ncbi:IS110 family transposase [Chitinophaga barathri]|uniref:IS110 family transposase n=2 Tax=Chitinophaga barathri TaxID=1647451 RepID=A0A3N4M486_9BACT|nr:IS110 family transposase [Chitinophaga barathri]
MKFPHIFGIDVSKKVLDVVCHTNGQHLQVPNTLAGFEALQVQLRQDQIAAGECFFIFEHTGLYSKPFERFCQQAGWPYRAVPGLAIKRSAGITRGKSDRVDAARIARYGHEKREQLKPQPPVDQWVEKLTTLMNHRDKLVCQQAGYKATVKEQQRFLQLEEQDVLITTQQAIISCLQQQIARVETAIMQLIRSHPALNRNYELLISITAIGFVNAVYILAATGNFTRFATARKFACYCGIAPFEHSSGSSIRGTTRVSPLANKKLKSLLDLAAKCAINYDKELGAYYQRRIAMGKSKMGSINVVRNKLIYRMFAVIKRQTPFDKNYLAAA